MTSDYPIIIAEAGVNHNGSLQRAREMVAAAAKAGADYVKFQAFDSQTLVASDTKTADYQSRNTGVSDQRTLLKSMELDEAAFDDLAQCCKAHGIKFLCTAFDERRIARFIENGMDCIKIASGELTNAPALIQAASFGVPIILSTGMATIDEIEQALETLTRADSGPVTLLHCTSLYPAPEHVLNLRAIASLRDRFGRPVGYSDHSDGIHIPIAATALGATVIEKHFTLDRGLPGPDHLASLEPDSLSQMISAVRRTADSLGDGVKKPSVEEEKVAALVRRSWHAHRPLAAGTVLTEADICLMRPNTGLSPYFPIMGKALLKDVREGQALLETDLKST